MTRKSSSGRYIISAAEVGSFVVCQEAWRLRELAKTSCTRDESVSVGAQLHQDWANQFDEVSYLHNAVRVILFLMLIAIFFHLVINE